MSAFIYHSLKTKLSSQNLILGSRLVRHSLVPSTIINHQQRRFLDLQEYQSKQLLHENGVSVQRFKVVTNETEINKALFPEESGGLENLRWSGFKSEINDAEEFVIKAQVLAGGRGKGRFKNTGFSGGVVLTKDRLEACSFAKTMLNDYLITKQTTQKGVLVEKVMIAEAVTLRREFYFAIVLDRSFDSGPILVTSPYGGMDIEEVAAKSEDAVRKFTIPIDEDLDNELAMRLAIAAFDLNLKDTHLIEQCADQMVKLHKLFLKLDATQIEINPLGVTDKGQVICVDSKINFDESSRFRQKWLDELEIMNRGEVDSREYEAKKANLNFIGLDGTIGCLVNGAGLAMATMDIIKLHGGQPANFLDVGGGATVEQVTAAFKIIESDINVKAIFVNIFGGIMRCDTVAKGIIEAGNILDLKLPIVVRLEGTRVNEAKQLIRESELNIMSYDDFDEAAEKVVSLTM